MSRARQILYVDCDGVRRPAVIAINCEDRVVPGRAGLVIGWIVLRATLGDVVLNMGYGEPIQDLPVDAEQYSYVHGGEEYRAACRAAWEVLS